MAGSIGAGHSILVGGVVAVEDVDKRGILTDGSS